MKRSTEFELQDRLQMAVAEKVSLEAEMKRQREEIEKARHEETLAREVRLVF